MVASEPLADSKPMSRTVAGDRDGESAVRLLGRLGGGASSTIFDLDEFRLEVR